MPFRPNVNDTLTIGKTIYRFSEHPSARGMPYGQSGRRGTVYQICGDEDGVLLALKVFTQSFRSPGTAESASRIHSYTSVPGLQVCARLVITPEKHATLLEKHPDLKYACLMPWVSGATWQEVMIDNRPLTQGQSLNFGFALVRILATMEQKGLAHCDLSGPNIILPGIEGAGEKSLVELVDVEEIYARHLSKPEKLSAGSPGYAHKTVSRGIWDVHADRFAGAVILAEMLCWFEKDIRNNAYGEQFFDPAEIHQDSMRYQLLHRTLSKKWGEKISSLFEQTWKSKSLENCPHFIDWGNALFIEQKKLNPSIFAEQASFYEEINPSLKGYQSVKLEDDGASSSDASPADILIAQAVKFEKNEKPRDAIQSYRQALAFTENEDVKSEIAIIVSSLENALPLESVAVDKPTSRENKIKRRSTYPIIAIFLIVIGMVAALLAPKLAPILPQSQEETDIRATQTISPTTEFLPSPTTINVSQPISITHIPITVTPTLPPLTPKTQAEEWSLVYVKGPRGKQDLFLAQLNNGQPKNLSKLEDYFLYDNIYVSQNTKSFVLQNKTENQIAYIAGAAGGQSLYKLDLKSGSPQAIDSLWRTFYGLDYSSSGQYLAVWGKSLEVFDFTGKKAAVTSVNQIRKQALYSGSIGNYNAIAWAPTVDKIAFWYYPIQDMVANAQLCILDVKNDNYQLVEFPTTVAEGNNISWIDDYRVAVILNQDYREIYIVSLSEDTFKLEKPEFEVSQTLTEISYPRYIFDSPQDGTKFAVFDDYDIGVNLLAYDENLLSDLPKEYWLSWAPDSNHYATYSYKNKDFVDKIFIHTIDNSSTVEISPKGGNASHWIYPNGSWWSPDGKYLSILDCDEKDRESSGKCDLYISDLSGSVSKITEKTEYFSTDFAPVWSPDSKMIAYATGEETGDLVVYSLEDGSSITVDTGVYYDTTIHWVSNFAIDTTNKNDNLANSIPAKEFTPTPTP